MNKEKSDVKKQGMLIFIGLLIFVIVSIVVFFATKSYLKDNSKSTDSTTNIITLNYASESNDITVYETSVFEDKVGKKLSSEENVFDFSVSTKIVKGTSCNYEIVAVKDPSSTIPDNKVKIYLEKSDDNSYSNMKALFEPTNFLLSNDIKLTEEKGMLFDRVNSDKSNTIYYRLRVWVDSSYTSSSSEKTNYFKLVINIYGDM